MKKKILKSTCALLLCCSVFLTGCIGMTGGDNNGGEFPDNVNDAINNSDSIMMTQNNVTYYYDSLEALNADVGKDASERNTLKHAFGDAYVFVDPGAECKIYDNYTSGETTFNNLVKRQIELLTDGIYKAINRIYIKGYETSPSGGNNNSISYEYGSLESESLSVLPTDLDGSDAYNDKVAEGKMDLTHPYTYAILSGMVLLGSGEIDAPTGWFANINKEINGSLEGSETTATGTITINSFPFKFDYAILGGYAIEDIELKTTSGENIYNASGTKITYSDFGGGFCGDDYKWIIANAWADESQVAEDKVKAGIKMCIASALSGISIDGLTITDESSNSALYTQMCNAIDHLGFTTTDKLNIKNSILDNIIGDKVVKKDNEHMVSFSNFFGKDDDGYIKMDETKVEALFLERTGNEDWQYYKGYDVVIGAIIEQAMNAVLASSEESSEISGVTLFPGIPRAQILIMDSWKLMDSQDESSYDESEDSDILDTDVDSMQFEEKFGENYKIIGILLMPKKLYGERTMAIKENGEWVTDSDGNAELKTFTVEGFMMSACDLVLLSEEDKTVTYQPKYEINANGNTIKVSGDVSDAGYEKPEPTEEASYNTTSTIDIDKQKLIECEESEVGGYRIKGYDGLTIASNGYLWGDDLKKENEEFDGLDIGLGVKEKDDIKTITLSTLIYQYIGVGDINGDDGTTFAGYVLDLTNFAGDNYVLANFSILSVNDNDEDRDAKFNILYFYMDTI